MYAFDKSDFNFRNYRDGIPIINHTSTPLPPHPLTSLPREDLDLITELVLQGGSLKDVAAAYGVSYPTIRIRVDKTIARLRDALTGRKPDPLSELLAALVERGELSVGGARSVRDFVRAQGPGAVSEFADSLRLHPALQGPAPSDPDGSPGTSPASPSSGAAS